MRLARPTEFTLTDAHIKLLRRACIGWQNCETGAPEIDPKRPYGNSYVIGDVAEILGEKATDPDDDSNFSEEQRERLMALHQETETALQIVLATGAFTPGRYVCREYSRDWRLADAE